jgi:hypothetical protein
MRIARKCPTCKGKSDGYTYEADPEQLELGYPTTYKLCATCMTPLLISLPATGNKNRQPHRSQLL